MAAAPATLEPAVEEEEPTFDQLFALKPDVIPAALAGDEEEEEDGDKKDKKKGKKKAAARLWKLTYDPGCGRHRGAQEAQARR